MITTSTKKSEEIIKMSLTIFAQRMKQAREEKGFKQKELAKAVGVTPTTISAYEKSDDEGNGKKPTLENAQAIAQVLNVSLDWMCGISDNDPTSYTDFTANEYLKSLITVLIETSSVFDDTLQNGIILNNPDILQFSKKINDLIKVYRAGSIPEDLFNVCIDKIVNDFSNYYVIGNCILDNSEYIDAEQTLYDVINDNPEISPGMFQTSVSRQMGFGGLRKVKIFISPKIIDNYLYSKSKENSDNGQHNPTQK